MKKICVCILLQLLMLFVCDELVYDRSNAGLTDVPDDIPTNVTTINLSHNRLTEVVLDGKWANLSLLRFIDLSYNNITNVTESAAFPWGIEVEMNLAYNQLTSFPALSSSYAYCQLLNLSHNYITTFSMNLKLYAIGYFDLSHNPFNWLQQDFEYDGMTRYVAVLYVSSTNCSK